VTGLFEFWLCSASCLLALVCGVALFSMATPADFSLSPLFEAD